MNLKKRLLSVLRQSDKDVFRSVDFVRQNPMLGEVYDIQAFGGGAI